MFGLGIGEIVIIMALALILIGPKKLPELAKGLGKGIREFQKAKDEIISQVQLNDKPAASEPIVKKGDAASLSSSSVGEASPVEPLTNSVARSEDIFKDETMDEVDPKKEV